MVPVLTPLLALFAGAALLLTGHGLVTTLLPLRVAAGEFSSFAAGTVAAGYFGGLLVGALVCPAIVRRVGHIRAFAGFAALFAAATLTLPLFAHPAAWTVVRVFAGIALAGYTMVAEAWLSAATPAHSRGRVLAVYMVVTYAAIGSAQFLLVFDEGTFALFSVAALFISLAVLPVALTRVTAPALDAPSGLSLKDLLRVSPFGVAGSLGAGMVLGAFYGLAPLFAVRQGFAAGQVGYVMAAAILGGLALQWPVGWLSDVFDRRTVLVCSAAACALCSLGLLGLGGKGTWPLMALLVAFGGASFTLYPIALSHAADNLPDDSDIVSLTSGMLLVYGSGSATGPLLGGLLFDLADNRGLFFYTAAIGALLALFGLWRMTQRAAPPIEEQGDFVAVPRMTAVSAGLDPRVPDEEPELPFGAEPAEPVAPDEPVDVGDEEAPPADEPRTPS